MKALKIASLIMLLSLAYSLGRSHKPPDHEYQFDLTRDSIIIFDGDRKVGQIPPSQIEELLINDNQ